MPTRSSFGPSHALHYLETGLQEVLMRRQMAPHSLRSPHPSALLKAVTALLTFSCPRLAPYPGNGGVPVQLRPGIHDRRHHPPVRQHWQPLGAAIRTRSCGTCYVGDAGRRSSRGSYSWLSGKRYSSSGRRFQCARGPHEPRPRIRRHQCD